MKKAGQRKRRITVLLTALLLTGLAAGCGKDPGQGSSSAEPQTKTTAAAQSTEPETEAETPVRYKVDFGRHRPYLKGAKNDYAAGEEVTVCYDLIATDTDYSFYLDEERLNVLYEEGKGFVIRFTMPEHDAVLRIETHNSMIYEPPYKPGDVIIDYYRAVTGTDGGDESYELVMRAEEDLEYTLTAYRKEAGAESEVSAVYRVPLGLADRCLTVICSCGMDEWNGLENTTSPDGLLLVCRYLEGGVQYRVSSEHMPAGGEAAFEELRELLESCLLEENRIENGTAAAD